MRVSVVMPQLGLTMTEGTVSEWIKKPGDKVTKGEFLFIVSTDKADMEVESISEGILSEILVETGKAVPVGTVIAYLESAGEKAEFSAEAPPREQATEPVPVASSIPAAQSAAASQESAKKKRPAASPRARRIAQELDVDLADVQGTGMAGRIVEEDVRRAAQAIHPRVTEESARRRKLIAEKMAQSAQTIPHFTVWVEANAEELLALQETLKNPEEDSTGVKLTLTDILLKAVALALEEVPKMRAVWAGDRISSLPSIDLGLALATDEGVVGPVIHGIDKLDVRRIARQRSELVGKALRRRLSLHDLEGGVGTLSNLGMYKVDQFQAMITPGQSFVLAAGEIRKRPWVEGAAVTVRSTIILSLSVDHRVLDGAVAAQFIRKVANTIENPHRIN